MDFRRRYGPLERLLHDVAFKVGRGQRALADVETLLYRDVLGELRLGDPVFITALPRAGTTIVLDLLCGSGRFASQTYRDMPFVMCPILWDRFSSRFRTDGAEIERAHGDGLTVSVESPEAFEEVVWKEFWPEHYEDGRILPWTSGESRHEFDDFLDTHMRKVVALRRDQTGDDPSRYVSKNNANIARLECRPGPLDRGVFVVPFREPIQHAASMLRQHRRFTRLQAEDDFLRRYMEAAGHHEFGAGLRPVDFGGWLEVAPSPDGLEFWLRYWVAAYRHVLECDDDAVRLLSYERLTADPEEALRRLASAIGLGEPGPLVGQAERLRPPRVHDLDGERFSPSVLNRARDLFEVLDERADV